MEKIHADAGINLFLAEDSPLIRVRLAEMFDDDANVAIVGEAETAAAAIEGILRERPDVVVLDVQLVDGSGLEVLREIRRVDPDIVFIVFTGYPTPQYRKACMEMGAGYFLDKNTEFERVKQIVVELSAGSTGSNEV